MNEHLKMNFCENPQTDNLLVVMDDLALPLGQLRFRKSGSDGGHNGLADILQRCGERDISRLRIGIGAAPGVMDPKDYVLGKFRPNEQKDIGAAIQNPKRRPAGKFPGTRNE